MPQDFWPNDLINNLPISPKAILQAQASQLKAKTGGRVVAWVGVRRSRNDDVIVLDFKLNVPSIDYNYTLASFSHEVSLFPVADLQNGMAYEDEGSFKGRVREILSDYSTKKIVRALIVQAEEAGTDEVPF